MEMKKEKVIDEYMDWLEQITITDNGIDSIVLKALPKFAGSYRQENPFAYIYRRIDEFARENDIEKGYSNAYEYYSFKYNDVGYTMLKSKYDDTFYECHRARPDAQIEHYIDFSKIIESEKSKQKVKKI